MMTDRQDIRFALRLGFFLLFVLAPPLDILRFDLTKGHFIVFGQAWTLGIGPFLEGHAGAANAAWNLFVRAFLPVGGLVILFIGAAWKYGRLYCGWLCPHFSVVELINGLMRRASGKPTLWERAPLPKELPDGRRLLPNPLYWAAVLTATVGFAFLWAVALLTYLMPPATIYQNIVTLDLTRNQALFLSAGTVVFIIEFMLARHLFCRFGCAVGLFQSLAWMANNRAMVVGFDIGRVKECIDCNAACDNACPMRLKPRTIKRKMFTCTQCTRCITACDQVQQANPRGSLLQWVSGDCALEVSQRDFGRHPQSTEKCFEPNRRPRGAGTSTGGEVEG